MAVRSFDLFDVFPWSYGFVHTGVLQWLLRDSDLGARALRAVEGREWSGDANLGSPPQREAKVAPRRAADLGFVVDTADGPTAVALETKVEDAVHPSQLQAYRQAGRQPVLFLPGLTGFLQSRNAHDEGAREGRLPGSALAAALADHTDRMPQLVSDYLRALQGEAAAFDDAVAQVQGDPSAPTQPVHTNTRALNDVAWLVSVQEELLRRHRDDPAWWSGERGIMARDVAFDRGLWWQDSWRPVGDPETGGFYIDVIAMKSHRRHAVVIKAHGGNEEALEQCLTVAMEAGPPADDWRPGRRSFRGGSMTCWSIEVTGVSPNQVADTADLAAAWIDQHASSA